MLRTFLKPLTTAAICFAIAMSAAPSFAASNKTSAKKKTVAVDPLHVKLLTSKEIRRLSLANKRTYFRSLQTLMTTVENYREPGEHITHYGFMDLFMPPANAESKVGDLCPIGGYWGQWHIKNGGLSCGAPSSDPSNPNSNVWDAPADERVKDKGFFCGPAGNEKSMGRCNSAIFLYGDDGQRFCQPIQHLSSNCQKAFDTKYSDTKDPSHEVLKSDLKKLMAGASSLDGSYQENETQLNKYINPKKKRLDTATANLLLAQIGVMKDAKKLVDATPESQSAEVADGSQATLAPPPAPGGVVQSSSAPPAASTDNSGTPATSQAGGAPAVTAPNAGTVTDSGEESNAVTDSPVVEPANPTSGVLGKELSCVSEGLKTLGYSPSDRYLSFLGVGVQAFSNGGYDVKNPEQLKRFQSKVISMVQSFGVCDDDAYPPVNRSESIQIRRWLTHDYGTATSEGVQFIRDTSGPSSGKGRKSDLYQIFGIQKEPVGLLSAFWNKTDTSADTGDQTADGFRQIFDQKHWDNLSLNDRQKVWTDFAPHAGENRSVLIGKCQDSSKKLISKDATFQFDTKGARTPAIARAASGDLCKSMAKACGLEAEETCPDVALATDSSSAVAPVSSGHYHGRGAQPYAPAAPAAPAAEPVSHKGFDKVQ